MGSFSQERAVTCLSGLSVALVSGAGARGVVRVEATRGSAHDSVGTTHGHRGTTCCLVTSQKGSVGK